jgi:hypothetical protein
MKQGWKARSDHSNRSRSELEKYLRSLEQSGILITWQIKEFTFTSSSVLQVLFSDGDDKTFSANTFKKLRNLISTALTAKGLDKRREAMEWGLFEDL